MTDGSTGRRRDEDVCALCALASAFAVACVFMARNFVLSPKLSLKPTHPREQDGSGALSRRGCSCAN
jgi:hypothetical protein